MTFGQEEVLVDAFPGGASRPTLSRDGRTLAFVRRVRDKEALVLKYVYVWALNPVSLMPQGFANGHAPPYLARADIRSFHYLRPNGDLSLFCV